MRWLEDHQNDDGGWGEDCRSYDDPAWIGRGASTASQTAWALLALDAAGERSPAAQRGRDLARRGPATGRELGRAPVHRAPASRRTSTSTITSTGYCFRSWRWGATRDERLRAAERARDLIALARGGARAGGDERISPSRARCSGARRQAHLMAIYGYARLVDDVGDEAHGRSRRDARRGRVRARRHLRAARRRRHPVMAALADTIAACRLPPGPFKRLLAANRQDQRVTRYGTFAELLDYCSLSAAPVGELVLHVFGAATPERVALSDHVCAGLQVLEHLQDVAEDYARGRVYLPQDDLEAAGRRRSRAERRRAARAARVRERAGQLRCSTPARRWPARCQLRPRIAVAGFIAGGRSALDALRRGGPRSRRAFAVGVREGGDRADDRAGDRGRARLPALRGDHPARGGQLLLRHPAAAPRASARR